MQIFLSIFITIFVLIANSNCSPKKTSEEVVSQKVTPTISNQQQISIFHNSPEEDLKPTVWDTGDTTISNEDRYELFQKYVKGVQGGYIGVGSTQNFTFAAWAKSEWIWMMDFTRIVVAANKIHASFIRRATTPEEFRNYWNITNQEKAYTAIEEDYAKDPTYNFIKSSLKVVRPFFLKRVALMTTLSNKRKYTIWFKDTEDYQHIRSLILNNKVRFLRGDITGPTTVQGIAKAAKDMGVTIRVIYFSNAEEYLKTTLPTGELKHGYTDGFKKNWLSIPIDAKSLVIRSYSQNKAKFIWPEDSGFSTQRGFHYHIMLSSIFQQYLSNPGHVVIQDIMSKSTINPEGYSTLLSP